MLYTELGDFLQQRFFYEARVAGQTLKYLYIHCIHSNVWYIRSPLPGKLQIHICHMMWFSVPMLAYQMYGENENHKYNGCPLLLLGSSTPRLNKSMGWTLMLKGAWTAHKGMLRHGNWDPFSEMHFFFKCFCFLFLQNRGIQRPDCLVNWGSRWSSQHSWLWQALASWWAPTSRQNSRRFFFFLREKLTGKCRFFPSKHVESRSRTNSLQFLTNKRAVLVESMVKPT